VAGAFIGAASTARRRGVHPAAEIGEANGVGGAAIAPFELDVMNAAARHGGIERGPRGESMDRKAARAARVLMSVSARSERAAPLPETPSNHMAKTYEQLQQEIQALQAEADKLRRQELEGVIARIREAIALYDLTPAELGFGAGSFNSSGRKSGARGGEGAGGRSGVTYSNGAGGTWGGRGKRPRWLRDALAAGRALDEFRVDKAD
jgi:DNA-binding protein H-NS